MQYTPTRNELAPGSEEAIQAVLIPLERFSDGTYRVNGQPYERIMLWFQAVSLYGYESNQTRIEIIGEVKPENLDILRPQVFQPVPFLSMDRFGQSYQAEGCGSALTQSFSPSDVPPGTHKVIFMAYKNSNWNSAQVVHLTPVSVHAAPPAV